MDEPFLLLLIAGAMALAAVFALLRLTGAIFMPSLRAQVVERPIFHAFVFFISVGFIAVLVINAPALLHPRSEEKLRARARSDALQIVVYLKAYKARFRYMPGGGNAGIVAALGGKNDNGFAFATIDPSVLNDSGELLDPWGTPYRMNDNNPDFPWVYSFGPDGHDDGGAPGSDDVTSW